MKNAAILTVVLLLVAGVLLAILLGGSSCGDGGERLVEAETALEHHRYAEARALLLESHGPRPGSANVVVLLARDVTEALGLVEDLAGRRRKDAALQLLAARIALISGKRGAARTWMEEARLAGADRVVCDAIEATILAQSGDRLSALERLEALVRNHPDHAEALWTCALLVREAGRPEEAIRLLRRAVAADPRHPQAQLNLARTLRGLGREEEAVREVTAFLASRPDHLGALLTLARTNGTLVRWTEAIATLEHAAEAHPDDADVLNQLGMALKEGAEFRNERLSEAIRVFKRARELAPRHVLLANNLARCLVHARTDPTSEEAILIWEELLTRIDVEEQRHLMPPGHFRLVRNIHKNVGLVLSDTFRRWAQAFPHYESFYEMGGEEENDAGVLDEWGKVLEGLDQPFRAPPKRKYWPKKD